MMQHTVAGRQLRQYASVSVACSSMAGRQLVSVGQAKAARSVGLRSTENASQAAAQRVVCGLKPYTEPQPLQPHRSTKGLGVVGFSGPLIYVPLALALGLGPWYALVALGLGRLGFKKWESAQERRSAANGKLRLAGKNKMRSVKLCLTYSSLTIPYSQQSRQTHSLALPLCLSVCLSVCLCVSVCLSLRWPPKWPCSNDRGGRI